MPSYSVTGDVQWGTAIAPSDTVALPAGSSAYTWTLDAPRAGRWIYLENWYNSLGAQVASWVQDENGTSDTTWTRSGTIPSGAVSLAVRIWWGLGNSTPGAFSGTVTITVAGVSYCEYGTEANPDAQIYSVVTAALIDTLALLMGWGPLVILAIDTLIGAPILFPSCDNPPPAVPDITGDNLFQNAQHAGALFANALWHFYCRCKPATGGGAAPTPYPQPVLPTPYTTGSIAPIVCNNEDICSALNDLSRQLAAIQAQITYGRADVTLIQRQHVPFAYLPGITHVGLSGQGYITVSGILALSVLCTTRPGYLGLEIGAPDENLFIGHITLGNAAGYERRVTVTHIQQLIMGIDGTITSVGYSLEPGVIVSVQELLRES